jgi:hypothetical protein
MAIFTGLPAAVGTDAIYRFRKHTCSNSPLNKPSCTDMRIMRIADCFAFNHVAASLSAIGRMVRSAIMVGRPSLEVAGFA